LLVAVCVNACCVMSAVGNTADAADDPALPAGARAAGPDVATAGVLWYSARPRTTQQVRVVGTVPTRAAARTQAAAGEVAQRGQGRLGHAMHVSLASSSTSCVSTCTSFYY